MIEDDGELIGSVMVTSRPTSEGTLATVYAAGHAAAYTDMARWGVLFARAAGASIIQTTVAKSRGDGLADLGLKPVRPWWRMDRSLVDTLPEPAEVPGYELVEGTEVPHGQWSEAFNRSFADHWRYVPRVEEEITARKLPELCLMAVTVGRREPAAMVLAEVEESPGEATPQPVGILSCVGTLPEHRRRGLARWLVADSLRRLLKAGARHATLYVDGMSPMRAYDVYRKLGFEVMFEAEVWEAT